MHHTTPSWLTSALTVGLVLGAARVAAQGPTFGRSAPAAATNVPTASGTGESTSPAAAPSSTVYRQPKSVGLPAAATPAPRPDTAPVGAQPYVAPGAAYPQPSTPQAYVPSTAAQFHGLPAATQAYGQPAQALPPGQPPPAIYGQPSAATSNPSTSAVESRALSLAVLGGYGQRFEERFNPWAAGLGVAAGYNFIRFHIGVRFLNYFGTTVTIAADSGTALEFRDVALKLFQLGAVAGYDIAIGRMFRLRPGVGGGAVTVSAGSTSQTKPYAEGALAGLFDISSGVFLGAEARLQFLFFEEVVSGANLLATVGVHL